MPPAIALPASRILDPMEAPPLRWGILGTGMIAGAFAHALRTGTRQRLTAVGSRTADRARTFAADNGVAAAYGSYRELVESDVDVVYVATPHSAHAEDALLAIGAGKPVLIEKAFTRNRGEAEQVVRAARERGLFAMEAMWARFLPHYDVIRQTVASGVLGQVHTVFADHGQLLWPGGPQRLSDPALAGGALLDLGIYPISFASMLLGDFTQIRASGTLTEEGVDSNVGILVANSAGAQGVLNATMAAKTPTTAVVAGDKARLEVEGDFYMPNAIHLVSPTGERLDTIAADPAERHRGLRYEAAEVARCISVGAQESPLMPLDESLAIMGAMDEVRAQIGVRYPGE